MRAQELPIKNLFGVGWPTEKWAIRPPFVFPRLSRRARLVIVFGRRHLLKQESVGRTTPPGVEIPLPGPPPLMSRSMPLNPLRGLVCLAVVAGMLARCDRRGVWHSMPPVDTTLKVSSTSPGSNAYLALVRRKISSMWSAPPVALR